MDFTKAIIPLALMVFESIGLILTTPENALTYHNTLFVIPKFCISIVFSFSWGDFNSQEKPKTMLMQNFGMTNKEYYGTLWYFLEWSIDSEPIRARGIIVNNQCSFGLSDPELL